MIGQLKSFGRRAETTHRERAYIRQLVRADAKIYAPDMSICIDCVVKDVSQGGALVSICGDASVPDRVYVRLPRAESMVECEVRWKKLNLIGLRYIDTDVRKIGAFVNGCSPKASPAAPVQLRKSV